ncbi:nitrate- and nitrite sensing domain-containing protein [Saccharopolyspora sp. TS4A08]|uniref:histidine kinase n=1 Tax=Saccharopolyspora ipomoeae TaxID=3042027 RepID=A0ABT6PXY3_9PSEU|nr:nitrate- and nitrite sensing domain-containing protein [Saccharopolyspora sp. TS4A08]MDI2032826.1 nitrate- and nitrite sensing domain-containing protein [Saccharopolyspora sp. TS4A08]
MTRSSSGSEHKTIRARLTRVGLVPSIILLGIWLAFSAVPVYQGVHSRMVATEARDASVPSAESFTAIQQERRLSIEKLTGAGADAATMTARRVQTDRRVEGSWAGLQALADAAGPEVAAKLQSLEAQAAQLPKMRQRIDSGQVSRTEVLDFYDRILDTGFDLFESYAHGLADGGQAGHAGSELLRAADQMSRATSLGTGALAAGEFTQDEHLEFAQLVGAARNVLDSELPVAEPRPAELGRKLEDDPLWAQVSELQDQLIEHPPERPGRFGIDQATWRQSSGQVTDQLATIGIEQVRASAQSGVSSATGGLVGVIVGSVVALLAMLLGILLAARNARVLINRVLISRLERLRDDTLLLATERLPNVMERLEHGEDLDIEAELTPLDYGTDEIGQVADAFNTAHHTAVVAAVKENQAKEGANKVFLGIAHRNQGLVHRQLKTLDKMERGEEHPERLEGLFQLDHLATRSRRNAENLIILAGEKPGRQWRKPVRLIDVIRSAVAETEHYYRIRVHPAPELSLVGAAVGDVIHLLAELMDNATSYSPPRSQVQVHASDTPRGVLIQIEDEGLGMRPADRDEANVLMATTPRFEDITRRGDSRLGLFVVARLAARRGIEVDLREAEERGTVAFVLLPPHIVAEEAAQGDKQSMSQLAEKARERATERSVVREARTAPVSPIEEPVAEFEPRFPSDDPDEERPRLPRRDRQQNLAPQLRNEPEGGVAQDTAALQPERTRGTMSAFQRGTLDARRAGGRDRA